MNRQSLWAAIIIILIIVLAGWWLMSQDAEPEAMLPENPSATTTPAGTDGQGEPDDGTDQDAVSAFTVRYTDAGFSPSTMTVAPGTTVTFINQSGSEMWVASDEHPSHTGYDGTSREAHCASGSSSSFDQCGTGPTYSFTFTKAGTWAYHNHRAAGDEGTIVVTE